jgi:hypothetical protein
MLRMKIEDTNTVSTVHWQISVSTAINYGQYFVVLRQLNSYVINFCDTAVMF